MQPFPPIIQGGMGVAVSGWRLARAVAEAGQLGVVSGTALDAVHARQLQDGDPGGHLRRAYEHFPFPGVVDRVLDRWYIPGGRGPGQRYRKHPMLTLDLDVDHLELIVLSNFGEVWLAKEGHNGLVGINYLEKIQMATPSSAYGAMLAGVDAVLMGAGIPSGIPRLLNGLAALDPVSMRVDVAGAPPGVEYHTDFDPAVVGRPDARLRRPSFLAVVGSVSLAKFLIRDPDTRPDALVVEMPTAGGHNAPPRGRQQLDELGQPVYGQRDEVDLSAMAALGLPFWLAGEYGTPEGLAGALDAGAKGVQVGTAFALCVESGMMDDLRAGVRSDAIEGHVQIRTDPRASPSGFPFKVVSAKGSVSDPDIYGSRRRVCDLGYLRTPYVDDDGVVGYRCASEPVEAYVRKGGTVEETEGRMCLCNGLTATVGLGQVRRQGVEPPLVTGGEALRTLGDAPYAANETHSAREVIDHLLGGIRRRC